MSKNNVSSHKFVKGFLGFSVSTWINCIIEFVSTPIVALFYAPEQFGMISMFLTYVDLFLSFSYVGLDQAFTRFYNEPTGKNTKRSILTVCLSGSMISCVIITVIIFLKGESISVAIIDRVNYLVPLCVAIGVFSQCILRFFKLASRMQKNIKMYTIQSITLKFVRKLSFIFIAFASPSALPAIVAITFCTIVVVFIFFFFRMSTDFSLKCDYSKNALTPIFRYSAPLIFGDVIIRLNNKISSILLNSLATKDVVGIYSFAAHIAAIINVIQQGFNAYWTPFVYENYKTNQKLIERFHHIITFIMTVFGLSVMLFQYPIFLILSNGEYDSGRAIFALLLIAPICYTISETLGLGIHLSKKTYWHILISAVNIIINISLCVLFIPKFGIFGAALSSSITAITNMTLKTIIGERYYKCTSNYWRVVLSIALLFSAALASYFWHASMQKYLCFVLFIIVEILIYFKEFLQCIKMGLSILKNIKVKYLTNKSDV